MNTDELVTWVDRINDKYQSVRIRYDLYESEFRNWFPPEIINSSYFVVVDSIPNPGAQYLKLLSDSSNPKAITLDDTIYIKPEYASDLRIHFHELVHVCQWKLLGKPDFIFRYMNEIIHKGYDQAPLEVMAHQLDRYYSKAGKAEDIFEYVQKQL